MTLIIISCSSTPANHNDSGAQSFISALNNLQQQLDKWYQYTGYRHQLTPVSECRIEIESHWSNTNQRLHRAISRQKFSFSYDLRSIELTPDHVVNHQSDRQYVRRSVDIIFNRALPITTDYYSLDTFESFSEDFTIDNFSLLGVYRAPTELTAQIIDTLSHMAELCANDLIKRNQVNNKIVGRWELNSKDKTVGLITIDKQQAVIQQSVDDIIAGPYQITKEQDYYRLIINPDNQNQRVDLALEFVNSIYARVIWLQNVEDTASFAPNNHDAKSTNSDKPLSLKRLGDIL